MAIELKSRGFKAIKINLKHCEFRKKLLEFCKNCFLEFFNAVDPKKEAEEKGKTIDDEDVKEIILRRKHKLFGNIEFVGELFIEHLL